MHRYRSSRSRPDDAASRFAPPVVGGAPHAGPWTVVGTGRLGIARLDSDVDYMVALEDVREHLGEFRSYEGVPGAYWKETTAPDGTPATVVAVPRAAYRIIDESYRRAVQRYSVEELLRVRRSVPKDDFYRAIGVVYTVDAVARSRSGSRGT